MKALTIRTHAQQQFRDRAALQGVDGSPDKLKRLLSIAKPEKTNGKTAGWELFKRSIIHGKSGRKTRFLVAEGWRFVIGGNLVRTVERVKPHENFKR